MPGRGEYLNENAPAKPTSSTSRSVSREILLGLAGEADDEIRRERDVGPRGAQPLDDAQIIGAGVAAVHRGENAVGAGLHRQMQMRHQRRQIAMRGDQTRRPCRADGWWCSAAARCREFRRGDAAARRACQARPSGAFAVIGVDVLADQRDLAHAGIGEPLGFGDDLRDRPRDFGAARIGHDAEGAELVAAFLHGDEGRDAARARRCAARRREMIELVLGRKFGVDDLAVASARASSSGRR